jgi:cobalt-zinc-cadmium efflux system outer membrane protein
MRRSKFYAGLTLFLLSWLVGGCSSTIPSNPRVEAPLLGRDLPRHDANQPRPTLDEPEDELSLREALALALLYNAKLLVFAWEIRIREAEGIQSGLWSNPELGLEVENFGGTGAASGFGGAETTLSLSQLVELGGKRSKRLEVAGLNRDLAAWDYERARIDVLSKTADAFVTVLAAQEKLVLAGELNEVAKRVLQSVERRVQAGATSPVERNRARVAAETARIDRERAEQELSIARHALSAQWGGVEPRFVEVKASLDELTPVPPLSELVELIDQNPRLARWSTEMARLRTQRELARAVRVPDLSIGAGVRHFNDTDEVGAVVGFSLSLPSFDRNQGSILAAELRLIQAEHARQSDTIAMKTELQAVHAQAKSSYDEALALRDRAIPEAGSAFALSEQFYSRGRRSFTDVLDTERTLFELQVRHVEALLRYHTAVAQIERLTGAPLSTSKDDFRRRKP